MTKEKVKLFDSFLSEWPVNRLRQISIDEYTNLEDSSFTYWIEIKMRPLGSIKGGSSFKFGVYRRQDKEKKESNRQYMYQDDFAWYKKYGNNKQEAFEKIKKIVNQIVEYAQDSNLDAIEKIDLGFAYKWKIAFHYQDINNLSIVPIYTQDALKNYLIRRGQYTHKMSMAEMLKVLKKIESMRTIDEVIKLGEIIWDEYVNWNFEKELNDIENDKSISNHQKSNATSSIEFIEYTTKAFIIKRHNKHHSLEESFNNYLNSIGATNIVQDINYIDFQFDFNNKKYICELKPTDNQSDIKYAVRMALGQLIEYSYDKHYDYKVIVLESTPQNSNKKFLDYLKNNYGIYYLYKTQGNAFKGNIL